MNCDLCLWELSHMHRTVLASVPPPSTPLGQSPGLIPHPSQPSVMCPLMRSGRLRVTCRVLKPQNTREGMPGPTLGESEVTGQGWGLGSACRVKARCLSVISPHARSMRF